MSGAGPIRPFAIARAVRDEDGRHLVLLDDRPLGLPEGGTLFVPGSALAAAIAAEWQAARDAGALRIDRLTLTRLAATAIGRVRADRDDAIGHLLRFAETDLLCHRASSPPALVAREARAWDPWLDWARDRLGATLRAVEGVMPAASDAAGSARLGVALEPLDEHALAVLLGIVPLLGSLVLGLAVVAGDLDAVTASGLATLDAAYEAEQWGEEEVVLAERERLAGAVAAARRYLDLVAAP